MSSLLDRFLAGRSSATGQAYRADLTAFARFVGAPVEEAVEQMLAGEASATRLVLAYAAELRRQGAAPATISRRLGTLRALVNLAGTGYLLRLPGEDAIQRAMAQHDAPYLLPHIPEEIDRLDVQHYAFREGLKGNYLAPIGSPAYVLDVGAGTGLWGFEMCAEFPDAEVVGFDLVAPKPSAPANYRWRRGNLLDGLPFPDGSFDFTHMRLMCFAIPLAHWPAAVAELVRVTRPGGWVELVEPVAMLPAEGDAIRQLVALTASLAAARGLDSEDACFRSVDGWLRGASLLGVNRRVIEFPVGEWGGRLGSLMASDARAAYARLLGLLDAVSAEEGAELLTGMQREVEELRVRGQVAFAFGRKPLA